MIELKELQEYCKGKRIIIVGNSSRILNGKYRKDIDSYDIVVRINKGYLHRQNIFSDHIGTKTNILSLGLKSATFSANIIQSNTVPYILSPIIYSERLDYDNVYDVDKETYNILKKELGGFKPSTGISTYNFFNRFINFERLDLIGFDFFESSTRNRNQLGHCYVDDHHGVKEFKFFERTKDPEKTKLYHIEGGVGAAYENINIPTHHTHNYTIKNNRRR